MKIACLSVLAALIAAPALAADGAQFDNPTPVDTTRPFLFDGVGNFNHAPSTNGIGAGRTLVILPNASALSVESYSREDLLQNRPDVVGFVRSLTEIGLTGGTSPRAPRGVAPDGRVLTGHPGNMSTEELQRRYQAEPSSISRASQDNVLNDALAVEHYSRDDLLNEGRPGAAGAKPSAPAPSN